MNQCPFCQLSTGMQHEVTCRRYRAIEVGSNCDGCGIFVWDRDWADHQCRCEHRWEPVIYEHFNHFNVVVYYSAC